MDIGIVIATAEYELSNGRKLALNVGRPRQSPHDDWFCPWQFVGNDGTVHAAHDTYGIDSVQALQLAMRGIDAALLRLGARRPR